MNTKKQPNIAAWIQKTLLTLLCTSIPYQFALADLLSEKFWKTATVEAVKQQIASGQNVNQSNRSGYVPLMYAVANNTNPKVIDVLLDAGANVHAISKENRTNTDEGREEIITNLFLDLLEQVARSQGDRQMLKELDDLRNDKGGSWTPLMHAARYNPNPEVLEALLDEDSNLKATDSIGRTALMIAAQYNQNPAVIEFLLDEGANPETQSQKNYNTLDYMHENLHLQHSEVYWKLKAQKFQF